MIYLDNRQWPDATAYLTQQLLIGKMQDVLILVLPPKPHDDVAALLAGTASVTVAHERTLDRYVVRMHYRTVDADDNAHTYVWLLTSDCTTTDNPAYYEAQATAARAEAQELTAILGDVAEAEYMKAMEEINSV